ncbi:hypothetical protein PM082_004859 [Marasmius tenuissimus]|nr:hypothetical protein PM082_004859 [Marasmius tenuissimus]
MVEGTEIRVAVEDAYNKNQTVVWLRDRLVTASNVNEIVRMFLKLNALLERLKSYGPIQEFQNCLIDSVKEVGHGALSRQGLVVQAQCRSSEAHEILYLPPTAGTLSLARHFVRQLLTYMERSWQWLGTLH